MCYILLRDWRICGEDPQCDETREVIVLFFCLTGCNDLSLGFSWQETSCNCASFDSRSGSTSVSQQQSELVSFNHDQFQSETHQGFFFLKLIFFTIKVPREGAPAGIKLATSPIWFFDMSFVLCTGALPGILGPVKRYHIGSGPIVNVLWSFYGPCQSWTLIIVLTFPLQLASLGMHLNNSVIRTPWIYSKWSYCTLTWNCFLMGNQGNLSRNKNSS